MKTTSYKFPITIQLKHLIYWHEVGRFELTNNKNFICLYQLSSIILNSMYKNRFVFVHHSVFL